MEKDLETQIKIVAKDFLDKSEGKEIFVLSHFDTDGISSASIMVQALKKLDRKFTLKIIKSIDKEFIKNIPGDKIILILDLGSGNLEELANVSEKEIYVIDHHEIHTTIPEKIKIINPELYDKQKISASGLTYLFCRELDRKNIQFAKLAILGMIGDLLEKELDKLNHEILSDGEVKKKRGLLIYPSTRPLNVALEFSSNPYIEGVTGNTLGVIELLREAGLAPEEGKYKSLLELKDDEMERLITAIMLKNPGIKQEDIIGDIFLIKIFNKLEDARELSAKINACSRFGEPETALQMCMEITRAKKKADLIHIKYKQELISAIKFISETNKIIGEEFVIINTKDKVKDTMIGTMASIIANSHSYKKGTSIFTMAYDHENEEKIKISARTAGREGKNVRKILSRVIEEIGGEIGGHEFAAGGIISKEKEEEFIECLKRNLEIEVVEI